jgi:Protein of unknown function (DUF3102)
MSKKIKRDLKVITKELHAAQKREAADVIAIGKLLNEAKDLLEHGEWLPWLAENFGSSDSTAENYMNAARFAAKFPTVGNLMLRPTALYALGNDLDQDFDCKTIDAILREAETKWVTADRVWEIAEELMPQPEPKPAPEPTLEEIEAERATAETAAQAEIDDILDGPPPELPPAPKATVQDVILPSFEQAIKTLTNLQTKSLEKFAGTAHRVHDIRAIADFLHGVADLIDRQQKQISDTAHDDTGRHH